MERNSDLLQRLVALPNPTASDKKLVAYFEKAYPKIAFENLERISSGTALSTATVTRFVRKLGYTNFNSFITQLREEVANTFDSGPRARFFSGGPQDGDSPQTTLLRHMDECETNLRKTLEHLDMASFDGIARLLSDESRKVFIYGIATGEMVMQYFHLLLRYFRSGTTLLNGDISTLPHRLADVDEHSVLLAMSIDRNSRTLRSTMRYFAQQGCEIALICNRRSTPFLEYTKYPLLISTDGASLFRTRVSAIVILEALISAVGSLRKNASQGRFARMEAVTNEMGIFFR